MTAPRRRERTVALLLGLPLLLMLAVPLALNILSCRLIYFFSTSLPNCSDIHVALSLFTRLLSESART